MTVNKENRQIINLSEGGHADKITETLIKHSNLRNIRLQVYEKHTFLNERTLYSCVLIRIYWFLKLKYLSAPRYSNLLIHQIQLIELLCSLHQHRCIQCLHYVVHICTLLKLKFSFEIRYIIDCKPVFRLWRAFCLVLWRNSSVVGSGLTMKRRWLRSLLLHFVFLKTQWKGVSCDDTFIIYQKRYSVV